MWLNEAAVKRVIYYRRIAFAPARAQRDAPYKQDIG